MNVCVRPGATHGEEEKAALNGHQLRLQYSCCPEAGKTRVHDLEIRNSCVLLKLKE